MNIILGVLIMCILTLTGSVFAQVYEKASDTQLKVTRQVEETYDYSAIKLKIQDLKDMQGEIIARANQEIAEKQKEIDYYEKLLVEADKLEVGKPVEVIKEEPIIEEPVGP